jgi:hypothetical protein
MDADIGLGDSRAPLELGFPTEVSCQLKIPFLGKRDPRDGVLILVEFQRPAQPRVADVVAAQETLQRDDAVAAQMAETFHRRIVVKALPALD